MYKYILIIICRYDPVKQTFGIMKNPYGDATTNLVELIAFLVSPATLSIRQGNKIDTFEANSSGLVSYININISNKKINRSLKILIIIFD